ncbi:hypothetical protein C8R43DRAFT_943705 [Mycena crocata]|nr:hypothetical protein C8R43DRAFT_943705 [Mycena crocata]
MYYILPSPSYILAADQPCHQIRTIHAIHTTIAPRRDPIALNVAAALNSTHFGIACRRFPRSAFAIKDIALLRAPSNFRLNSQLKSQFPSPPTRNLSFSTPQTRILLQYFNENSVQRMEWLILGQTFYVQKIDSSAFEGHNHLQVIQDVSDFSCSESQFKFSLVHSEDTGASFNHVELNGFGLKGAYSLRSIQCYPRRVAFTGSSLAFTTPFKLSTLRIHWVTGAIVKFITDISYLWIALTTGTIVKLTLISRRRTRAVIIFSPGQNYHRPAFELPTSQDLTCALVNTRISFNLHKTRRAVRPKLSSNCTLDDTEANGYPLRITEFLNAAGSKSEA